MDTDFDAALDEKAAVVASLGCAGPRNPPENFSRCWWVAGPAGPDAGRALSDTLGTARLDSPVLSPERARATRVWCCARSATDATSFTAPAIPPHERFAGLFNGALLPRQRLPCLDAPVSAPSIAQTAEATTGAPSVSDDKTCHVLFICTQNSARSIMAEGFLNHLGGQRFRAFSAGSHPAGTVHPTGAADPAALPRSRRGLPLQGLAEFAQIGTPQMHFVFTVCDKAAVEVCPVWPGLRDDRALGREPIRRPYQGSEAELFRAFSDLHHGAQTPHRPDDGAAAGLSGPPGDPARGARHRHALSRWVCLSVGLTRLGRRWAFWCPAWRLGVSGSRTVFEAVAAHGNRAGESGRGGVHLGHDLPHDDPDRLERP